jgi:hypothetical protein
MVSVVCGELIRVLIKFTTAIVVTWDKRTFTETGIGGACVFLLACLLDSLLPCLLLCLLVNAEHIVAYT